VRKCSELERDLQRAMEDGMMKEDDVNILKNECEKKDDELK
jgi:hypothetical protein